MCPRLNVIYRICNVVVAVAVYKLLAKNVLSFNVPKKNLHRTKYQEFESEKKTQTYPYSCIHLREISSVPPHGATDYTLKLLKCLNIQRPSTQAYPGFVQMHARRAGM